MNGDLGGEGCELMDRERGVHGYMLVREDGEGGGLQRWKEVRRRRDD